MNKRICPDDKIINPKTNRCVLKTGAIGKKIINEAELRRRNEQAPKPVVNTKVKPVVKPKVQDLKRYYPEAPNIDEYDRILENDSFYTDIERLFTKNSTRSYNALLKRFKNEDEEFVDKLFKNRQKLDFYPTTQNCLENFKIHLLENIDKNDLILEPTAGIGSILHFLQKNKYNNLMSNELNEDFYKLLKTKFPSVKHSNEDFLEYKVNVNNIKAIFCNPPFTKIGNKKYYLEFLFKCGEILQKSKTLGNKYIYFISPDITKNEPEKGYLYGSPLDLLPAKKQEKYEEFVPEQIYKVGSCIDFPGTNIKANLYIMYYEYNYL